jgi:uncharacterized membrane protein
MDLAALAMLILLLASWTGFIAWRRTRPFALCMLAGLGLMIALSIPATLVQAFGGIEGLPPRERPFVMAIGTPFNMGGLVVRVTFEAFVEPLEFLVGHRSATVLSNASFYGFLLLGHIVVVSALFAWLRQRQPRRRRLWIALWTLAVLLNSLLNARWPWWGS